MITWILIFIRIVPFIHTMIHIAEKMFDKIPDSGTEKRNMVIGAVKSLIQTLLLVYPNEVFEEIWIKMEDHVIYMINAACKVLFPHMMDDEIELQERSK